MPQPLNDFRTKSEPVAKARHNFVRQKYCLCNKTLFSHGLGGGPWETQFPSTVYSGQSTSSMRWGSWGRPCSPPAHGCARCITDAQRLGAGILGLHVRANLPKEGPRPSLHFSEHQALPTSSASILGSRLMVCLPTREQAPHWKGPCQPFPQLEGLHL